MCQGARAKASWQFSIERAPKHDIPPLPLVDAATAHLQAIFCALPPHIRRSQAPHPASGACRRHEGQGQHQEAVRGMPHSQAAGAALRHLQREPKGEAGRLRAALLWPTVSAVPTVTVARAKYRGGALAARSGTTARRRLRQGWRGSGHTPLPDTHMLPCSHLQHKQRQGIHTDAAAVAAAEQQQPGQQAVAAAAAAAAAGGTRGWLDSGASVGARLWQQLG